VVEIKHTDSGDIFFPCCHAHSNVHKPPKTATTTTTNLHIFISFVNFYRFDIWRITIVHTWTRIYL